jgi:4-hydroxyphenylpyruvate dioxygenase
MALESLGIVRLEALHYYVHDLARSRRFYTEKFDFAEVGGSDEALTKAGRQRSVVYEAGGVRVLTSAPEGTASKAERGRAARWLEKHPDGVGSLIFEVEDIAHTFKVLEGRGGTPITDIETTSDDLGTYRTFNITTPFGGSSFRFVERKNYRGLYPGVPRLTAPKGGKNGFGFSHIDHVTTNFETMAPALLWMEHVLGFERYWGIEFHTDDVKAQAKKAHVGGPGHGSGLRSAVMWDPRSHVKFANNEPLRPHFKASQINVFHEDQRGDGIQHAALVIKDIIQGVKDLRARGVEFMPTPASYYEMLPSRLEKIGVKKIDEPIEVLKDLEILVDGEKEHAYMLQIFLKDSAGLYKEREAGPFFYEIIQRKGDEGFGGGNFRALFESIERQQESEGRVG